MRPCTTPQRAEHEASALEDTATELSHLSLRQLIDRLSSRDPVPGGGSASAIAGAMGAALVGMVAQLTIGRPDAEAHATELASLRDDAARIRDELLSLAQTDAAAYAAVVAARKLPKTTDEDKAARRVALDTAMVAAADAPLRAARLAAATLELAARIAPIGNPNAASDAGVAAQLASAAVRGAILNVRINLPYLPADAELRDTAPAELEALEVRADEVERATVAEVNRRITPS